MQGSHTEQVLTIKRFYIVFFENFQYLPFLMQLSELLKPTSQECLFHLLAVLLHNLFLKCRKIFNASQLSMKTTNTSKNMIHP